MNDYNITHDYMEIIAGTTNVFNPVYMEAAENVEKNNAAGYGYLRNFVKSIDVLSKKGAVNDARITASAGNIKKFQEYEDIKFAIDFLSKHISGVATVTDCKTLFSKLEEFAPLYETGYTKKARLVMFEYDTALYVLVTALSMVMATNIDVVSNGTDIKITKKEAKTNGVIAKTASDYAKQLAAKGHKEYLDTMLKAVDEVGPANYHESVITEGTLDDMLSAIEIGIGGIKSVGKFGVHLVKGVKNSIFGIVPVIRSGMYLKYRKKADTINALDQQCQFIKMNIEQLKNKQSVNEKDEAKKQAIIKKQEATVEKYQKKAEKLRAQLVETEKEVATAIKAENPQIKNNKADDDFVLESYDADYDPFADYEESTKVDKQLKKMASRGYKIATNENPLDAENIKKALNSANARMKQILGTKWDESDKKKLTSWMDAAGTNPNLSSDPGTADAIAAVVKFMEVAPKEKKEIMHKLYKTCGTVDEFLKRAKKEMNSKDSPALESTDIYSSTVEEMFPEEFMESSEEYYSSEFSESTGTPKEITLDIGKKSCVFKVQKESGIDENDIEVIQKFIDNKLKGSGVLKSIKDYIKSHKDLADDVKFDSDNFMDELEIAPKVALFRKGAFLVFTFNYKLDPEHGLGVIINTSNGKMLSGQEPDAKFFNDDEWEGKTKSLYE